MALVLVSGVNGFIGSHVAKRLLNDGHRVRGLVRKRSDKAFIDGLDIELFTGDVTDRETLARPMKGVEVVVHVAGLASDWGPYERFYSVNVTGTRNMAETASNSGVKRFVHISTTALHGFSGYRDKDETFPMAKTRFPYCETKKIAEKWLFEFAKSTGMEVCSIRPGNVFGPRDHTFIEKYARALKEGKIGYIGGGKSWTCPTYVENLADGIVKACFDPAANGESFIITDGLDIDWKTFTEKLADALGVQGPGFSLPFWLGYWLAALMEFVYRLFGVERPPLLTRYRILNAGRDYHFSINKAKRLIGYRPLVPFDEAIRKTADWCIKRLDEGAL